MQGIRDEEKRSKVRDVYVGENRLGRNDLDSRRATLCWDKYT